MEKTIMQIISDRVEALIFQRCSETYTRMRDGHMLGKEPPEDYQTALREGHPAAQIISEWAERRNIASKAATTVASELTLAERKEVRIHTNRELSLDLRDTNIVARR